jgi:hypothetical protein
MAIAVGAYVRTLSRASITFVSTVLAGEHAVDQAPNITIEVLVKEPCELVAIDIEAGVNHLAGRTAMKLVGDAVTPQRDLHEVVVVLAGGEVDADKVAQVAELHVGGLDDVAVQIVRGEVGYVKISLSLHATQ